MKTLLALERDVFSPTVTMKAKDKKDYLITHGSEL